MAVDGKRVLAGLESRGGLLVERDKRVVGDVALYGRDHGTVEIDLGVFVVMNQQSKTLRFRVAQLEGAAEPDVGRLPVRADFAARRRRLAEAARALLPRGVVEDCLLPAFG